MSLLYGGSESKTFIRRNENNELEIVLDNDTLAKVYNYIDGYIKYRVREGIAQYGDKKQYVDRYKNASDQEFNKFISEMVLNYEIQYANLNDMFFGDEAFYKDSRDTIKRNKEYQAGGLSYAAYNLYNKDFVLNDGIKIGNKLFLLLVRLSTSLLKMFKVLVLLYLILRNSLKKQVFLKKVLRLFLNNSLKIVAKLLMLNHLLLLMNLFVVYIFVENMIIIKMLSKLFMMNLNLLKVQF